MEYVVDASIVVKWFIPEPLSSNAEGLLVGFRNGQTNLAAPDHLVVEVANALWHRSTLRGEIVVSEASESCADLLQLGLDLFSTPALVGRALQPAGESRHPVYDMVYVALAEQRRCQLVTADRKMVNKLSYAFPFVRWLGEF